MKRFGFKTRILIPAAALLCVLVTGFLYGIWSLQEYHLQKDFSNLVQSSQRTFKKQQETDANELTAALDGLCHNEKLQSLWRQGNRDALNEYAQPIYKSLLDKFNVTHFYFHQPDRVCFLRVHQPDRYGDLIKRTTLLQSQKTGGIGAGVEMGPLGTLTLRVVQPWMIDGQVVGYLELGKEITHFTREVAEILDVRVAVLIDKANLNREGWISGTGMHEKASNWDDLPADIILDSQPAGIDPKLLARIAASQENSTDKSVELNVQGTPYIAGAIPLFDIGNRKVGRMVLFQDIAAQRASLLHLMFKLGGYFFLVAVVSLLAAYYYLKNVEKLLNQSQSRVAQAIEDREAAQSQHLDEILQFRKAIECATDAIAIIGLDRQLRYINPAFVKLFGYSIEEANALGGTKSLYYDQQLGVKVYLKVSQGRSYSNEIKMLTKDNRNLEVYLRASPIFKEKSEMIGILAIFTDLSERKSTEQELLRQAQALVESNRALAEARIKASTTGENQA